ncbi:VPDSG-CTERM sorting domain-containing protein [Pelagicoccus sp. NFK12]|uniref:VPDSG-CTERM sorting domain-containing protein n=1 Tax=Pelagicoccus enzymogenes TaxID=2773457 RepID=A0A927F7W3_9BACT|nr:VPDSG-CTERM sorting domain-containing protein [Pelagicoccus enzymogenes]MBD5778790.1 VPDSG-CTERM sorting domain-containing protein [Pelagicoccus enzymogenes]
MKTVLNTPKLLSSLKFSLLFLGIVLSAQSLNADEDYYPTDETGETNPLEPVPDSGSTAVLVLMGIAAVAGAGRWARRSARD